MFYSSNRDYVYRTREDELVGQLNQRKTALTKTINSKIQMTEDRLKSVTQTKNFAEKIQKNWSEVEILNVRKKVYINAIT